MSMLIISLNGESFFFKMVHYSVYLKDKFYDILKYPKNRKHIPQEDISIRYIKRILNRL